MVLHRPVLMANRHRCLPRVGDAGDEAELGPVPTVVIPVPLPKVTPNNQVRCEEHLGIHIETVACRWPHNVHADGDEPQVSHPYRVTD